MIIFTWQVKIQNKIYYDSTQKNTWLSPGVNNVRSWGGGAAMSYGRINLEYCSSQFRPDTVNSSFRSIEIYTSTK